MNMNTICRNFIHCRLLFTPFYTLSLYQYSGPDAVMKNYFAARMNMSNVDIVRIFSKLKKERVPRRFFNDHRWQHLVMKVEKNAKQFQVHEKMAILESLVKIRCYDELFRKLIDDLMMRQKELLMNEEAILLYFMAKSGRARVEYIKTLCDSLLNKLSDSEDPVKLTYNSTTINSRDLEDDEQLQGQAQQFEQIPLSEADFMGEDFFQASNSKNNTNNRKQEIECRNLILALWAIPKLRVADKQLVKVIANKHLKQNAQKLPTPLIPLVLSTLYLHSMENKRIYAIFLKQIPKRKQEIVGLDEEKLRMTLCMTCRPAEPDTSLVLWLLETIYIKYQAGLIHLSSISAYQILINCFNAEIVDQKLYFQFLAVICEDLSRIKTKQIITLLQIVSKINKNIRKGIQQQQQIQQMKKTLLQNLNQNLQQFLSVHDMEHNSRVTLRRLIYHKKIEVTAYYQKFLIREERSIRRGQNLKENININQNKDNSKNSNLNKSRNGKNIIQSNDENYEEK